MMKNNFVISGDIAIVQLSRGMETIIDKSDIEKLPNVRWSVQTWAGLFYASGRLKGQHYLLHRAIMQVKDSRMSVDHINGDGLDNRKSNLRVCTNRENLMNRGANKNSTSGLKGVHRCTDGGKPWRARITVNRKEIRLGRFDNPIDAAHAYDSAAKIYFGIYAFLNFPTQNVEGTMMAH